MSLQQQIRDEMKESMKAKDSVRTNVLKGLVAGFTNYLVAHGKTPQDEISDDEVFEVIKKAAKQRKDSIEQFEKGGRDDLAETEKAELEILNVYLPEMMGEEAIRAAVLQKKDELGIDDVSKSGMLVGALMKDLRGKADGNDVKKVVDEVMQG